mgnify:CR=1 FL=1
MNQIFSVAFQGLFVYLGLALVFMVLVGVLRSPRFKGWRVGIVTSEPSLARATGLPFREPGPIVAHGGLKVRLYQTGPL